MTKRFIYFAFDITDDFDKSELKLYEIDNNPSNDLDESNLFYVYSKSEANIENIVDKLNKLVDENEQLKQFKEKVFNVINNTIEEETKIAENIEGVTHETRPYCKAVNRLTIKTLENVLSELKE